ncbi:MAG: Spy/CpxP family protein refolding chaperone [Betaproteobacteria bacterium]|nr:Spy/CpxP family protein refolding chaperone [Betaproteobacteria bacterium]
MKTLFNRPLLWIAASALMLQGGMVLGAPAQDQQPVASFAHSFDWTAHTQELLTDLKDRLALTASQATAWDAWSAGALEDARAQGEQMKALFESRSMPQDPDLTTPDRMSRKAERLRSQITLMQAHLARVEAAQKRTRAFYDQLDSKQKTIFDLFWKQDYRNEPWPGHGMMMFQDGCGYGPRGRQCPPPR